MMRYDCHGCIFYFELIQCCIVLFFGFGGGRGNRHIDIQHCITQGERG